MKKYIFLAAFLLTCILVGPVTAQTTIPTSIKELVTADNVQIVKSSTDKFLDQMLVWAQKGGDAVGGAIEKTGQFAGEQVPLLCRDIAAFGSWYYGSLSFIGLMFISLDIWCAVRYFKYCKKDSTRSGSDEFFGASVATFIVILGSGVTGFSLFFSNIENFIMATFAPRLYIVHQIMDMIKTLKG